MRVIKSDRVGFVPNGLSDLVGDVATPTFPRRVFEEVNSVWGCEHLSAFAFTGKQDPRPILTEDRQGDALARSCGTRYVNTYWKFDPVNALRHTETGAKFVALIDASDIGSADYRRECYTRVNLGRRLTLSLAEGGTEYRLNIYKDARELMSDRWIEALQKSADLLMALLRRHYAEDVSRPDSSALKFMDRLRAVSPSMPKRELQVCAQIARGVTSEGIACELGIGTNTVLTYRKRAYARLNISSQNELLRLIMR